MTPEIPPSLRPALESLAERLARRFGSRVRFVRLYGSWARGEAHEHSDVDVAVVIEGLTRPEWREVIDMGDDVGLETGVFLSPYVAPGDHFDGLLAGERLLARDIVAQGISV